MGNLMAYSGIVAKVRAMERWRLGEAQFEELREAESVPEAVQYLRGFPPYEQIFAGMEDRELHRGEIEQCLNRAQYQEFAKLYKFANLKQRRFLDIYFMHYEISIIKTCLRNAAGQREQRQDLSEFKTFFDRHSSIDLIRLSESRSVEQFIENLKGSLYYPPLELLEKTGGARLPACEAALDMLYFKTMWRVKDDCISKEERALLSQCFGTRMDMLNIQWICRSKKYYHLSPGEIYAVLIPIRLHLTKQEINDMVQAESLEQVRQLVGRTWYGAKGILGLEQDADAEALADEVIDRIYRNTSKKDPYSVASLNACLYFKEREIRRIINIIEQIRYGVHAG